MAELKMFVICLANQDLTHYAEVVGDHTAWVDKHAAAEIFLYAGPLEERTAGGMIVAHAESREALDLILCDDPFLIHGIATHEVLTFVPTRGRNFHALQKKVAP
jgi:uncharacterized protein YciI